MIELKFKALFRRVRDDRTRWQTIVLKKDFNDINLNAIELTKRDYAQVTPWLQYTGKNDKNDKEIYQGDIITQGLYFNLSKSEPVYFITEFFDSSFWFIDKNNNKSLITSKCAKVGNIYENPELLGNENKNGK